MFANRFERKLSFEEVVERPEIRLYAGDVPHNSLYKGFVGLSVTKANRNHILHDMTNRLPLPDSCVDYFQSEDVFEHISREKLPNIIDEIYRVLKPLKTFRLALPDYGCDLLQERTQKDRTGALVYDPGGGGDYVNGKVINGGHVWFPTYGAVTDILSRTRFRDVRFLHYYDDSGLAVTHPINYAIGHVQRTPDHDSRVKDPYRPLSIVVDCVKD